MKKTGLLFLSICLVFSIFPMMSFGFNGEVQVGAGSYTTVLPLEEDRPPEWGLQPHELAYPEPQPDISSNVSGPDAPSWKPTPTSDWWTNMNWDTFSNSQYPHPLAMKPKDTGIQIYYPGRSKIVGIPGPTDINPVIYPEQSTVMADLPTGTSNDFVLGNSNVAHFPEARTGGYSDWFVTADFYDGSLGMSVSYGHGSPYVYAEYEGGNPSLTFETVPELFIGSENDAMIGVIANGNYYGLFGPTGSTWSGIGTTRLVNNLPAGKDYFSLVLLPDVQKRDEAITAFNQMKSFAYSFITDTTVNWSYDEVQSKVYTNFSFTVTPKEAAAPTETLMALYPTQWRGLDADFTGYTYGSMQGTLKTLIGNSFTTEDRYTGILPSLPYLGDLSEENMNQLKFYLEEEINRHFPNPDDPLSIPGIVDTYFTGKEMTRLTTLFSLAEDLASKVSEPTHKSDFEDLAAIALDKAKFMVTDWLTASDENGNLDNQEFFYYNDTWGAMLGYREGFWSAQHITDHHFHYGYFIKAAAEIARVDEQFLEEYGDMVNLIIRNVASPDRDDPLFPFLRNFDPYAGHSWADGKAAFGSGNNQESVSEAINAWTGVVLWGELLSTLPGREAEGEEIRDLGIYLYTSEVDASNEYYFDMNQDIYPEEWDQVATTIVWGGKVDNTTFWTKNPAQRHAILWLPLHGGSFYLGHDTDYVLNNYNSLQDELPLFEVWGRAEEVGNPLYDYDVEEFWDDLQWMYLALADPTQALALMNNSIASSPDGLFKVEAGNSAAFTYSWIHSLINLGSVDGTVKADYPFYTVFKSDNGDKTYVVYNMTNEIKIVNFSDGQQITVAPKSFNTDQGVYIPDTNPPSVPVGLSAKRTASNYVTLEWEPSTDDRGVVGYDIFVNGSYVDSSTEAEAQITGLSPTTTYTFTVKARDMDTISGESAPLHVTTTIIDTEAPSIPTSITSIDETDSSIHLDWNDSSDNILTVEYDVYRDGIKVATTEDSNFKDVGLESLTFYVYQIVARDAEGNESGKSEETDLRSGFESGPAYTQKIVETTPTRATFIVEPYASLNEVILLIQENNIEVGYNLIKDADGVFQTTIEVPENGTLTYRYNTIDTAGVGMLSQYFSYVMGQSPEEDTEAPSPPTNLSTTTVTGTMVNLTWTASSDNMGVTGYDVYKDGAFENSTVGTSLSVTGLTENTTYTFTVVAKDGAGNVSSESNAIQVTTTDAGTGNVIVEDDYTIEIVETSATSALFKLTRTSGTSNWVDFHYNINNAGQLSIRTTNDGGSFMYELTNLSSGDIIGFKYTYEQDNLAIDSPEYQYSFGSDGGEPDTIPPSVPTNVSTTAVGETTINLIWTASTDNVGVVSYEIYKDGVFEDNTAGTSYTVIGLTGDTTYAFTIVAKDEAGNVSVASDILSVTTNPPGGEDVIVEEDYTIEIVKTSATSAIFKFTRNSATSNWVDIHYKINHADHLSVRTVNNGGIWEYEFHNLSAGTNIEFWYTYEKDNLAYDSPSYEYIH
ncbi:glycosyl hydrolase [Chengkuizengella marina]|uniref:glucan endo-1,3-beta-D-glucosidase n=1 Tax=Chengkuizengella marina TaxID=2507566 RepID=A0A6N9Q047_9BACL|nr:glycosyl hydrolase [Chengkuizengella marina]NBI28526.1 hypothetical protein [Chengkuizengella marina]